MTHLELEKILRGAQHTLFWDERQNPPPLDSPRLRLRIMELGTWEHVRAMERTFSKETIIETLENAPYGSISPMTFNFWCLRLDVQIPYPDRFATRKPS